jgi:2-polyprenyl-3-methyl-5-hydroxy-6-metoxy-1,4-benzoquinol methylase
LGLFNQFIAPRSNVLEVGCGGSVWLPYFAKHLKCKIWGIDYSKYGVALVLRNLKEEKVSGNIILGDVFDNHDVPKHFFDVIWSAGFIEHFNETQLIIKRLTTYLKPRGMMITLVPNLEGFVGWLHKVIDLRVYQAHVKISPKKLDALHREAGLEILSPASYFGVYRVFVCRGGF